MELADGAGEKPPESLSCTLHVLLDEGICKWLAFYFTWRVSHSDICFDREKNYFSVLLIFEQIDPRCELDCHLGC